MTRFGAGMQRIKKAVGRIHLVDRCLILFMLVLLLQSGHSLFNGEAQLEDVSHIDVVIRTSSAGIFGYFLSANFIRSGDMKQKKDAVPQENTPVSAEPARTGALQLDAIASDTPKGKIGFSLPEESGVEPVLLETGQIAVSESADSPAPPAPPALEEYPADTVQIVVATVIGLFCLAILILIRNNAGAVVTAANSNASATATVAQFRDFVSGCVGFLIGCPTTQK